MLAGKAERPGARCCGAAIAPGDGRPLFGNSRSAPGEPSSQCRPPLHRRRVKESEGNERRKGEGGKLASGQFQARVPSPVIPKSLSPFAFPFSIFPFFPLLH